MASYSDAVSVRDVVFDFLWGRYSVRPRAIGIMPLGSHDYAIKVTLPQGIADDLPDEVQGVPIQYDLQTEPAVLAGGTPMAWHEKALNRRR
jgi:hypothetical protein